MIKKSVARVLACLLTDGGVTFRSRRNNTQGVVFFVNKSPAMRELFSEACEEVFRVTPHDDGIECRIFSDKLAHKLTKNFSTTFRKKTFKNGTFPSVSIPKGIMEADEKTIKEFLKFAFSCDGSAHLSILWQKNRWFFQKRIQLKCTHPVLRKQFHELLLKIGIEARKEDKENRIIIDSTKNLLKFIQKVGFVDGVRISGKGGSVWKGLEKNEMLKIFLFLFEIHQSLGAKRFQGGFWMKNFKNKNDIIKFLRKKVRE